MLTAKEQNLTRLAFMFLNEVLTTHLPSLILKPIPMQSIFEGPVAAGFADEVL